VATLKPREGMLFYSLVRLSDVLYADIVSYIERRYDGAIARISRKMILEAFSVAGLDEKKRRELSRKVPTKLVLELFVDRMEFVREHIRLAHARVQLPFHIQNGMQDKVVLALRDLLALPHDEDRIAVHYGLTFKVPLVDQSFPCRVISDSAHSTGRGRESYVAQREFMSGKYSTIR